jgi:hypothetical protein
MISPRFATNFEQSFCQILCIFYVDNTYDSLTDWLTMYFRISAVCLFGILLSIGNATELTFELEDNARQCFHEVVKKGIKTTLEYQVCSFFSLVMSENWVQNYRIPRNVRKYYNVKVGGACMYLCKLLI